MKVHAYLNFNGNCEEAFLYYAQHLGGKVKDIYRFEGAPDAGQMPEGWGNKVMHAALAIGEDTLMGADAPEGQYQKPAGTFISLHPKDVAEGKRIFEALSEGGNVIMPYAETFWTPGFAMFVDKFGTPWMVNVEHGS